MLLLPKFSMMVFGYGGKNNQNRKIFNDRDTGMSRRLVKNR